MEQLESENLGTLMKHEKSTYEHTSGVSSLPRLSWIAAGAAIALAACAQAQPPGASIAQGASTSVSSASTDAVKNDGALYWYDGGQRRALVTDNSRLADFRKAAVEPLRPAAELAVEKDAAGNLPTGVSPVLREADAPAQSARALPGGVIVQLRAASVGEGFDARTAPQREARARAELSSAGLTPVQALDPSMRLWLVQSAPGLPSLELANRLHESGRFESAQPNWWQARVRK